MKFLILILLISTVPYVHSQNPSNIDLSNKKKESKTLKDRIYYGGDVGLVLGKYTMIGAYPLVGYKFTSKLSSGIKMSYEYIKDSRYTQEYTTSTYGGSLFSRYRFIPQLYAHAEYAQMSYEFQTIIGKEREWVPFLFLGAGYSQAIGGRSWMNIQILFDVLQDDRSPYKAGEPFYSMGFGVGF